MSQKHQKLAFRLSDILTRLNEGRRLSVSELAEEFKVSERTIQRDLKERLAFLDWDEEGPRHYSLNKIKLGQLYPQDIHRFANFASIQNLFPKIDRDFFQAKLNQSIHVKGHNYEDISAREADFNRLKEAIDTQRCITFNYTKKDLKTVKRYTLEPYLLLNKSGIWYLIGLENGRRKTFCFSQTDSILLLESTFQLNSALLEEIKASDSLYHGNQIKEVIVQIAPDVAHYFTRRNLLPNQEIIRELDHGGLLIASKNVHEQEILPIARYWIPHITIVSPPELQRDLLNSVAQFLEIHGVNG